MGESLGCGAGSSRWGVGRRRRTGSPSGRSSGSHPRTAEVPVTSVEFLPAAQAEFEAAAEWYEGARRGLGADFVDHVEAVLELIAQQPNRFPRWDEDARYSRAKVPRFPFFLFYLAEGEGVHIVAVAHGRREPGYWRQRAP